ncbi:MAG: hypothetical protein AAF725_06075 [Acidobacteriota bacterium]
MSARSLNFEKETLRNLAGPELYMQTNLQPLGRNELEQINGGGWLGEIVSGIVSAVGSAIVSGVASAIGSGAGSAVASSPASAASSAAASAVSSAASGASASLVGSAELSGQWF